MTVAARAAGGARSRSSGGENTNERMFLVSTVPASPSSFGELVCGMSVWTVALSALTSSGNPRDQVCAMSACSRSDSRTRCWRAARSKSSDACRERA